ncbi:MAG: hypothetical protein FWF35_02480 [Elusimicrobia bacterium]|nr:hypothetical protein [Elusimicrobiota bacterium]
MSSSSKFILGVSAHYHDSAAALISSSGEIIAAAQEERFTRIKHDHSFPVNAIAYCLKAAGGELEAVAYYEKPILKFERALETSFAGVPGSLPSFVRGMISQMGGKLSERKEIRKHVGDFPVYFTKHHEAHAAAAFFPSPFKDAAVLCIDGVGEWDCVTWGVGSGNKITARQCIEFPHSLGLLYSAFTGYLGFKVDSGEYKVMGLAPYGAPKYAKLILDNIVELKEDGSFWLDQKYFDYCWGKHMYSREFDNLFKRAPRKAEALLTQDDMDMAASIQEVMETIVMKIARNVKKESGAKNLCMAGGCALNCTANGKLLRSGLFDDIWVQPASGDAGCALGAALAINYHALERPRVVGHGDSQKGSLLGPSYTSSEIKSALEKYGAKFKEHGAELNRVAAKMLAEGKIIARFAGRAEFGPRALGNRSILADARNPEMQKKLNLAVKKRESFRPFAPSCLEEDVSQFFDLDRPSPYMLFCAQVAQTVLIPADEGEKKLSGIDRLRARRSKLPAITHVDGSARIQTVSKDDNPDYWKIISEFKKLTGYGCIVNTSFNVRGEPLVGTPEDAYRCFMYADIDALVLEDLLLLKEEQPPAKGLDEYFKKLNPD